MPFERAGEKAVGVIQTWPKPSHDHLEPSPRPVQAPRREGGRMPGSYVVLREPLVTMPPPVQNHGQGRVGHASALA